MDKLSAKARAVLEVVADDNGPPGERRGVDTEAVSARALEIMRHAGGSYSSIGGPPWYGIHDECRRLRDLGFLTVDQGIAQYHVGTPAPTADRFYLVLTEEGSRGLTELRQGDATGPCQ